MSDTAAPDSGKLILDFPKINSAELVESIKKLLSDDLGVDKTYEELSSLPEIERPLNGRFDIKNSPEEWAEALYNYFFFAFQKRLRDTNTGGLGALWDIIPADTRIPDHTLWHHLGLTSAISSSLNSDKQKKISLVVFSITPVQEFITKARKLRDYWTGSVLLSYLAFTGIRYIMKGLGPDHIIYPSLHNQTFIEQWLGTQFYLKKYLDETNEDLKELRENSAGIASFPNKFVFICAHSEVADICEGIQSAVEQEWKKQSSIVKEYLGKITGDSSSFDVLFKNQTDTYWKYSYASSRLTATADIEDIQKLLPEEKWKNEFETIKRFSSAFKDGSKVSLLYGTTHSLIQGVLAAGKMKAIKMKPIQNGEKCPLCGENEVLHSFEYCGTPSAKEYSGAIKVFWDKIRNATNTKDNQYSYAQTGENERLCAVCAVKRYLPVALKQEKYKATSPLLAKAFSDLKFPSTTELATSDYRKKLRAAGILSSKNEPQFIDSLHNYEIKTAETGDISEDNQLNDIIRKGKNKEIPFEDKDKYYAILLMDGDKMGDLINGTTISAKWEDVLHPDLVNRFKTIDGYAPKSPFQIENKKMLSEKRTMNPALHAMISDSLNNFARFGVQPLIKQAAGKLIYAGGDDVCAVLPLSTVLKTADDIRKTYILDFASYTKTGPINLTRTNSANNKIGIHLGSGSPGISLSGAIVIAHHKTPLREVMQDAHRVLNTIAKEKAGRNALAIRLKKRSGGDRDFWMKWDEKNIFSAHGETIAESFKEIISGVTENQLSSSLLYRIADLKEAITPMIMNVSANKSKITALFAYEVKHSGNKISEPELFAERLAGICIKLKNDTEAEGDWFNPEAAIIANYLAKRQKNEEEL